MLLKDYCKLRGISRPAAARELGVDYPKFWRWCEGKQLPRPADMIRIRDWSMGAVQPNDLIAARAAVEGESYGRD